MNSKRRVIGNYNLKLVFVIATIVAVITVCFSISTVGKAQQQHELLSYYESVQIQPGDTLSSLAQKYYINDIGDFNKYVNEIRELNNISGDDIHAGEYVTIKYYETASN
ncbi:MAG: LysM peptidoglycan-binding domain-containing protein [Lachnospiraceae bacterium]|nr:LysM peptidoglycan-binding domain-containing protein [Lachnospiraceae bacterium]